MVVVYVGGGGDKSQVSTCGIKPALMDDVVLSSSLLFPSPHAVLPLHLREVV